MKRYSWLLLLIVPQLLSAEEPDPAELFLLTEVYNKEVSRLQEIYDDEVVENYDKFRELAAHIRKQGFLDKGSLAELNKLLVSVTTGLGKNIVYSKTLRLKVTEARMKFAGTKYGKYWDYYLDFVDTRVTLLERTLHSINIGSGDSTNEELDRLRRRVKRLDGKTKSEIAKLGDKKPVDAERASKLTEELHNLQEKAYVSFKEENKRDKRAQRSREAEVRIVKYMLTQPKKRPIKQAAGNLITEIHHHYAKGTLTKRAIVALQQKYNNALVWREAVNLIHYGGDYIPPGYEKKVTAKEAWDEAKKIASGR